ncbi:family 43 glycosylhydrolase [Pelobium manganitolerans]|uniref:family 43 glycosylhydrolase n=1 Tax=Pelobium manganitolerans TaxID=1842495 RepID=UPI003FA3D95E
MKKNVLKLGVFLLFFCSVLAEAQVKTNLPRLHVEGRYLKDPHGNTVNLHGFAQTYSPYFNDGKWSNFNVADCLNYNKGLIDKILAAGWKMNFIRLHMDPYWSNEPGCTPDYHESANCFSEVRFKKYLDEVFVPMAEYAVSKGLYVIMRPPGVCPEKIAVGDTYNQYLIKVWNIVAQHPKLKNHPNIMYELANEPIKIQGPDGDYGSSSQGHFDNLKTFFQSIVNTIRATGSDNILWIPGLGYQALYKGFAFNPIEGKNIGYAVHIYPGWFGSANGYEAFKKEWDINVKPISDLAPIVVTEMDWADEKYHASWGKGYTGTAGADGFGANFKKIVDDSGNVSWLVFTSPHLLAEFTGVPPAQGQPYTFLNDPEACPWPIYHWYQEYAKVDYPRPDFSKQSSSDNGDGTYTNPLIHADFPDPDVIRVGDVYYMVSTTMQIFPGATILKSYDLVNWEYCSNPLQRIESSACYNMEPGCQISDGKFRYARGQWATSIRYNNGKFYLLFTTLDEGSYLLSATDPQGTWDIKKLPNSYYDPGLFFDENGKIYVVHGATTLKITELDADFNRIKEQTVFTGSVKEGLEGAHLYKINGRYYIYATYGGFPSYQTVLRSNSIFGPYEEKLVLDDDNIHQGALVETQTGEWWTVLFYDKLPYGRLPNLQPIKWVDGWPEIGVKVNGVSKGVTTYNKPNVGRTFPKSVLPTNDSFRDYKLALQWGWNHNPDDSKWSLTDKPGFLRLKTSNVAQEFLDAKNTLTQRIFGYHSNVKDSYGTIKMNVENMAEGDVAGLAVFQKPDALIGVKVEGGQKKLFVKHGNNTSWGAALTGSTVYFRAVINYGSGKAKFYYSTDNLTYSQLGNEIAMNYSYDLFMGLRFGIYNYATLATGGYVDVDWFTTEESFSEDTFYDDSFTGFTAEQLTLTDLTVESQNITMVVGTSKTIKVTATYADGHQEDVTTKVTVVNHDTDVVKYVNGQIASLKDGTAKLTVGYEAAFGGAKSLQIQINSKMFPLTDKLFNPSIFEIGSFDETNGKLVTGVYGFGGWEYSNSLNLSDYTHLIVKFSQPAPSGFSFRIWDESSYWSAPSTHSVSAGVVEMKLDLHDLKKEEGGKLVPLDPSRIYRVGFWSSGNAAIYIQDVALFKDPSVSSDVALIALKKDGANVDLTKTYLIPKNNNELAMAFTVETTPETRVFVDETELANKVINVNTSKPFARTIQFKLVSADGKKTKTYAFKVEKRFNFDDIVVTRWDNTLLANANSNSNGEYSFVAYKWFKDDTEIGASQYYSAGAKKSDVLTGKYYVQLTTKDGQVLRSWEKEITPPLAKASMKVYPNPSISGQVLSVQLKTDADLLDKTSIEIYDTSGRKMSTGKATGESTAVTIPSAPGVYIIRAKSQKFTIERKIIVK